LSTTIRSMKNTSLGELEQAIMEVIWLDKTCSVRGVLTKLQKHRKIAYTTVATILHRLDEKGLVLRESTKSGYVYTPKVSRGVFSKNIANTFLKNFIGSFGDDAIASFADSVDKLPKEKKKYLLELLENYDKDK